MTFSTKKCFCRSKTREIQSHVIVFCAPNCNCGVSSLKNSVFIDVAACPTFLPKRQNTRKQKKSLHRFCEKPLIANYSIVGHHSRRERERKTERKKERERK